MYAYVLSTSIFHRQDLFIIEVKRRVQIYGSIDRSTRSTHQNNKQCIFSWLLINFGVNLIGTKHSRHD